MLDFGAGLVKNSVYFARFNSVSSTVSVSQIFMFIKFIFSIVYFRLVATMDEVVIEVEIAWTKSLLTRFKKYITVKITIDLNSSEKYLFSLKE